MKGLKDLTPEINKKIQEYKNKAIDNLYNGNEYKDWKKQDTIDYVNYVYKIAKQDDQPVVIIANDPKEYRRYYNLLFSSKLNKVITVLVNKIWVLQNKRNNESITESITELESYLEVELNKEISKDLKTYLNQVPKYHDLFALTEYSRVYLMWYKFIKDEFELPTKKVKELDWLYDHVNRANIAKCFVCKRVVLILRMPEKIVRNDRFISNVNGPAIVYPNLKLYYVNGVKISKQLFDDLTEQKYKFENWTAETNEEIKAAVLSFYQEKFGDEYVFRFLSKNLKEVNTYVNKKEDKYLVGTTNGMNIGVYTLFKGKVNNNDIAYVRCYCPSTDRMFFLGVNPGNTNAKDAIASLYSIPKLLVKEIVSIQRQGEIFSTNFTDKGLKITESLSKQQLQDTVGLSGEDYFNLIKYEF